ncbi:DNA-directed RNA polymerase I subunit rpa49 [Paramyrothecium foliicola]|nr:DNA-directed RNA polymerase I subunit rpa49 [Paramyrothecium foliicola]
MADLSNKKRKRDGEGAAKPKKKVAVDVPSKATVSSVLRPKSLAPVIATLAGVQVPSNLPFQSYSRKDDAKSKAKHAANKELLLHSSAHRSLDFTAKEEGPRGSKPLLNHFVGIYDPASGKLQVVEAKKMVVRGSVRTKQASAEAMGERNLKQSMMDLKTDLGQTFGTKKAKKAIRENVLNAIAPQKQPSDGSAIKIDDASKAMLKTVGEITSTMASREELQAVVDEAKPVPKANLEAEDIQDVYDPKAIIGSEILNLVPIREWQEKARHNESIQVPSQYVAARVAQIAASDTAVTRLRVLRYLLFVMIFYLSTKPGRQKGTRQVLPREKLRETLAPAPEAVIENIRRKFSDGGQMRKFHIDLLMTHCCVFASIVDNFEVDTQNLRDDLRIEQKAMNQYFHEIGGRVRPVTNKAEGRTTHVARLALPLDFPKQRHINPKRR